MMKKNMRGTETSANMMAQSLRSASGLPRDKRNWQTKKYANIAIPIAIITAISRKNGPTVTQTNINTKKDKSPRKKAPTTFSIFALPFQILSKLGQSSLAAPALSRDTDLEGDVRRAGPGYTLAPDQP
jgi:hypothetical protein